MENQFILVLLIISEGVIKGVSNKLITYDQDLSYAVIELLLEKVKTEDGLKDRPLLLNIIKL